MIFQCVKCKVPITKNVILTTGGPPLPDEEGHEVDWPPQGFFTVGPPTTQEPEIYPGSSKYLAFNLADMINTKHNPANLSGCCGLDGLSGINTLCLNGDDLGMEFSDCWHSYHYIQVPPENAERVEP